MVDNPWVVGIIAGIPSGLIVWGITTAGSYFFSKKTYYKQVDKANNEITDLLIMSVVEDKIPKFNIILSLLESTARQKNLKSKDIKSVEQTYNDLIKAVFETNFIAIEKKSILSEEIDTRKKEYRASLNNNNGNEIQNIEDKLEIRLKSNKYGEVFIMITSILISVITVILFIDTTSESAFKNLIKAEILPFLISSLSSLAIATYFATLLRNRKK